jgi:hypothetical protein
MKKQIDTIESKPLIYAVPESNSLPNKVHQIILGSLLGDMYCGKEGLNSHIEETHSILQKDYLAWKYSILKDYFDLRLYRYNNPICKAKEKFLLYQREYRTRPKVKEKIKEYNKRAAEKRKKGDKN